MVAGYTISNDGDVSGNHGTRDAWVVKLAPDVVPTIGVAYPTANMVVYPNPTHDFCRVATDKNAQNAPETFTYKIVDIAGREITQGKSAFGEAISTEGLPTGSYLLQVITASGEVGSEKIVKTE